MNNNGLKEKINKSEAKQKIEELLEFSTKIRQSDSKKSIKYAKEAAEIAKETDDEEAYIASMIAESYARLYNSEFDKAEELTTEIITCALKEKNYNSLGTAYNLKGRIAYNTDNPGKAKGFYLKALDYYLKEPEPRNLLSCYNNLGMCQEYLNNAEEALNYYDLALKEAQKLNHPATNVILMNIGSIYFRQERFFEALDYYIQAKKYFREMNLNTNLASVDYNIGLTYQALGNSNKSLEFFKKSYVILKELNNPKGLSTTCYSLADILMELDRSEEAYEYLKIAQNIAEENGLTWNLSKTHKLIAEFSEKYGDYKKANENLKKVIKLKDKLNNEMNKEKLSEMEAKFKTEIYKLKTDELNKENKAITDQLAIMENKLQEQRSMFEKLEDKFKKTVEALNEKDNLLTSQSRTAAMGEMLSLIAHQWKQPLNTIGVLVQSFQDAWEYNELSDEFISRQVDIVMKQILYMSETITDFRDFLKPERKEYYHAGEAIKRALNLLDFVLKKLNIEVITEIDETIELHGVENDLVQIIMNIVNNARQEMRGCNDNDCIIRITFKKEQDSYILRIYNSGSHLNEEVKNKIFEPYYSTKGDEGTGIGLYICKMIVENKFKGSITAENINDGVEFSIVIPGN